MLGSHFQVGEHLKTADSIKYFAQVRLDALGVLRFAEYFNKLFIGKEVEPWKDLPLGFQILIQPLLNLHTTTEPYVSRLLRSQPCSDYRVVVPRQGGTGLH
jgi:hypothetical protein